MGAATQSRTHEEGGDLSENTHEQQGGRGSLLEGLRDVSKDVGPWVGIGEQAQLRTVILEQTLAVTDARPSAELSPSPSAGCSPPKTPPGTPGNCEAPSTDTYTPLQRDLGWQGTTQHRPQPFHHEWQGTPSHRPAAGSSPPSAHPRAVPAAISVGSFSSRKHSPAPPGSRETLGARSVWQPRQLPRRTGAAPRRVCRPCPCPGRLPPIPPARESFPAAGQVALQPPWHRQPPSLSRHVALRAGEERTEPPLGAGPCPGIPFACSLDPGEPQARASRGPCRAPPWVQGVGGRTGGDWGGGGSRAGPTVMPERWWSAAGGEAGRAVPCPCARWGRGCGKDLPPPSPGWCGAAEGPNGALRGPLLPRWQAGVPGGSAASPRRPPVPQGWQSPVPAGAGGPGARPFSRGRWKEIFKQAPCFILKWKYSAHRCGGRPGPLVRGVGSGNLRGMLSRGDAEGGLWTELFFSLQCDGCLGGEGGHFSRSVPPVSPSVPLGQGHCPG